MFLANGYIRIQKGKQGGGIGEDGIPIPPSFTWSEPIPVHVRREYRNERQNTAYYDNKQTYAKYELVMDYVYWGKIESGVVQLEIEGHDVGICQITDKQPLKHVQEVRLYLHSINDVEDIWQLE